MIRLSLVFITIMISGCTIDQTFRVANQEILGATFIYCETKIKWDGVTISLDGLDLGSQPKKDFVLGRVEYNEKQIRELDTIAFTIDRMFEQMCSSTISLRNNPEALAKYINERDKTATKLFVLLKDMQDINYKRLPPNETISKQDELLNSVVE